MSQTEKLLHNFGKQYTKIDTGWQSWDMRFVRKKHKELVKRFIKKLFLEHK